MNDQEARLPASTRHLDRHLDQYRYWILWISLALVSVLFLAACVWARHLWVMSIINRAQGIPSWNVLANSCAGLALIGPAYAAILMAFTPFSFSRRLVIGGVWMAAVMLALTIGNHDPDKLGGVMMFSQELVFVFPMMMLGWLAPFSYLNWCKGWRLVMPGVEAVEREKITISGMFLLTFLVAASLGSLQFAGQRFISNTLVGMVFVSLIGFMFSFAIFFIMSERRWVLWVHVALLSLGFVASYVIFKLGFNWSGYEQGFSFLLVLFLVLIGLVAFRLCGGELQRGFKTSTEHPLD